MRLYVARKRNDPNSDTPRFLWQTTKPVLPSRSSALPERRKFFALLAAAILPVADSFAQQQTQVTAAAPTTVTQAVFRSRWVGPQVDQRQPNQVNVSQTDATSAQETPSEEELGISPFARISNPLRKGISLGPIDVHPSLSFGWEYSDQTNTGQTTQGDDTSSPFAAPALALVYDRAIGPWAVLANYAAGYRYYTNPNYTASGAGNQRNPFSQTGSLSIGHIGARHKFTLDLTGSYGTGLDIQTGQNLIQTNFGVHTTYDYVLTTYTTVGTKADFTTSDNSDGQGGNGNESNNGNVNNLTSEAYLDWLMTGKTRLRFSLGAGEDSQYLQGSSVTQNYVQTLVSANYKPKDKFTFDVGIGVGYVNNPGINSPKYVGARAIYTLGIKYDLTDKTSIVGKFGLDGTDIRPTYRLEADWQPLYSTALSAAVYQEQELSISNFGQAQISRGIIGTATQRLFQQISLILSAGWQQTENLGLSNNGNNSTNNQNYSYGFASAAIQWPIREWLSGQMSIWRSTGGTNQTSSNNNQPETRAVVSLNLTL